jgi:hypothetical protein
MQLRLEAGSDVNKKEKFYGCSLAAAAAYQRSLGVINVLLVLVAKVNMLCGNYDFLLGKAAIKGINKVVENLLSSGANVDKKVSIKSLACASTEPALARAACNKAGSACSDSVYNIMLVDVLGKANEKANDADAATENAGAEQPAARKTHNG